MCLFSFIYLNLQKLWALELLIFVYLIILNEYMYDFFLSTHSYLRWIVLLAGLLSSFVCVRSYFGKQSFGKLENGLGAVYVASLHFQVLVGLLLYFVLSPVRVIDLPEGWIKHTHLRYQILEHPLMMLLALTVGQIGRSVSRRAKNNKRKLAVAAILYPISLLILLIGIPWERVLWR